MISYLIKGILRYTGGCFIGSLLLISLMSLPAYGQKTDTVKLYYDINDYGLSAENKVKLRALNNSLSNTDSVYVYGFTDYLADKRHNLKLSANRADAIKTYLISFQKDLNISTTGKGAIARVAEKSPLGEPLNRRVDIIVLRHSSPIAGRRSPGRGGYDLRVKAPPTPPDYKKFSSKLNGLAALKAGGSISLEELTFQAGRHFLNPEASGYLDRLLQYFKDHGTINFQIVGHTCCDIEKRDALDQDTRTRYLSVNRARYIFEYFIENGIDRDRMAYTGVGSSKPRVSPEITEEDQYLNRRVEIIITGK